MKTHFDTKASETESRSVAQRAHSHHANSAAGPSRGAPFEEDLGAPLVQRKARSLVSAHSERVAQLQAIATAAQLKRKKAKAPRVIHSVEKNIEMVRAALDRAAPLLDEARRFFLPFPQPVDRQYLVNRLHNLDATYHRLQAEFDQREHDGTLGQRAVSRLKAQLLGPDFLPLLERTMPVARQFEPRLKDKLAHVFESHSRAGRGVRFDDVAHLVNRATPLERTEAGNDAEVVAGAARLTAPDPHLVPANEALYNHAPEFVRALDIQQPGPVVPHDPAGVDTAIRHVLGAWVHGSVARGSQVHGNVRVLGTPLFSAVEKKYTNGMGGGANAFTEEGTIYLHRSRGDPSTIVHEGIHQYAHGQFRDALGGAIDEGTTENFARRVAGTLGYNRTNYPGEFAAAGRLFAALGDNPIAAAYFSGNIDGLKAAFIARVTHYGRLVGDGNAQWTTFCAALKDRHWDAAFAPIEP